MWRAFIEIVVVVVVVVAIVIIVFVVDVVGVVAVSIIIVDVGDRAGGGSRGRVRSCFAAGGSLGGISFG